MAKRTVPSIVNIGTQINRTGGLVASETEAFGGVRGHHDGTGHDEGRAIDVNAVGPGGQRYVEADSPELRSRFDGMARDYSARGFTVIWNGYYWEKGQKTNRRADGHRNHIHIEAPKDNVLAAGGVTDGSVPGGPDGTAAPNIPSGPPMGADEAARLRTALDKDQDYYPNALGDFDNVSYHIRFFMMDQKEALNINPNSLDPAQVGPMFDKARKVIIAETGVTAGISIKDFSLTVVPNQTSDSFGGTDYEMTLVEPLGVSFYDVTYNAANLLNIENVQDHPWFVEISFKGYDDEGRPISNVLADYSPKTLAGNDAPAFKNGGRWFYSVALKTVDTNVTEAGATHVCKMSNAGVGTDGGSDGKTIPEMMTLKGRTLGEMFDDLARKLNDAQERRYMTPLHTYEFGFENNSATPLPSDPRSWSLTDPDKSKTGNPNLWSMDKDGVAQYNIISTKDIPTLLREMMSATKEAKDIATNGVKITDSTLDGAPQARSQILFNPSCAIKTGEFERIWGQYRKHYTWTMTPRFANYAITDPKHVQETKSPAVQAEMVKQLRDKGFFRKRFDYLYTGMNTEVMSFDIKFNMAWGAVLQNVLGFGYSRAQHTTQASENENFVLEARKRAEVVRALLDERSALAAQQITQLASATGQPVNVPNATKGQPASATQKPVTTDPKAGRAVIGIDKKLNALDQKIAAAKGEYKAAESKVKAAEQDMSSPFATKPGESIYAEDLEETVDPMLTTRIVQAPADTNDKTGTGSAHEYHRDRSIFGALMEQTGDSPNTMVNIEMEIKGDPFWMGIGNIQKSENQSDDPMLAAYDRGTIMFLLKVSYPFNQDENGNANFRNYDSDQSTRQDAFTGYYMVNKVVNKFADGQFTQSLTAFRHTMLSVAATLGYGGVEGELVLPAAENAAASSGSGVTGGSSPAQPAATKPEQEHTMKVLYGEFIKQGFSPTGAAAMVAQIGRENDYNAAAMFGYHTDASHGATNAGMVSWNGTRLPAFQKYMESQGLIQNGKIVQNDASLQAQARFVAQEMKSSYPAVYNTVRNPNASYAQIEPVLSDKYVGWDRDGRNIGQTKAQNALIKQNAYYARVRQITGG